MITGKLHLEGKRGGRRELYLCQSTESCIKDDFPKEIYFITKNKNKKRREEAAGREDMRGSNIEIFTANNNFPSSSVCKRRII